MCLPRRTSMKLCLFGKIFDCEHQNFLKLSQIILHFSELIRHRITTQPWCTTGLPVKPVSMINPLSQDLNGGLGTILLLSWHIKIIYKHHNLLTNSWSIYTTLPPVKETITKIRNWPKESGACLHKMSSRAVFKKIVSLVEKTMKTPVAVTILGKSS